MEAENEFELRRQQNIARNQQFLKNIGLAELRLSIAESAPAPKPDVWAEYPNHRKKRRASQPASTAPRRSLRSACLTGPALTPPDTSAPGDYGGVVGVVLM